MLAARSDLALQLLESRNASPASRVIAAVVDGEQAVSAVCWECETQLRNIIQDGQLGIGCAESSLCTYSDHTNFA